MYSGHSAHQENRYEIGPKTVEVLASPEFISALEAVCRLDEKAKRSPLFDAWRRRILYSEATANVLWDGDLINQKDLVMLDGGVYTGPAFIPLSFGLHVLQAWRRALLSSGPQKLLEAERPGLERGSPEPAATIASSSIDETELFNYPALEAWEAVLSQSRKHPPLLAAALIWDSWLTLNPERGGAWRATLLAGLVMRARGLTPDFMMPVDLGWRFSTYRRIGPSSPEVRMRGFLTWVHMAAQKASAELDRLEGFQRQLQGRILPQRRTSRLPQLIDVFMRYPVVNTPLIARQLGVSRQAATEMMERLAGSVQRLDEGRRYRSWGII